MFLTMWNGRRRRRAPSGSELLYHSVPPDIVPHRPVRLDRLAAHYGSGIKVLKECEPGSGRRFGERVRDDQMQRLLQEENLTERGRKSKLHFLVFLVREDHRLMGIQ